MSSNWTGKVRELKYGPKDIKILSKQDCHTCYGYGINGYRRSPKGLVPRLCDCVMKLLKKHTEEELDKILQEKKIDEALKRTNLD